MPTLLSHGWKPTLQAVSALQNMLLISPWQSLVFNQQINSHLQVSLAFCWLHPWQASAGPFMWVMHGADAASAWPASDSYHHTFFAQTSHSLCAYSADEVACYQFGDPYRGRFVTGLQLCADVTPFFLWAEREDSNRIFVPFSIKLCLGALNWHRGRVH